MIKEIKDHEGYFITNNGKVYCNLGKGNRRDKVIKTVELYEIKPRPGKKGYMRVYMRNTKTNKREDKYIHRLVAEAFIPNPNNYKYINHKNFKRYDNDINNLEWCSAKYNIEQTMLSGHLIRDVETGRYVSNFDFLSI